jgi:hypothetical protein
MKRLKEMSEIRNITTMLQNAFSNNPGYRPSVKDARENITATQATLRLYSSHSIIEPMSPITDWRNYTTKQSGSNAIIKFGSKKLSDIPPFTTHPYTCYSTLHGIIPHDLYHTGHIMIVKKHFGI